MRFLSAEIYSAAFFLRANIQKCAGALHKWERILVCRMRERAPITTRRAWKLSGRVSISKKMVFFMGERTHLTEISFLLFRLFPSGAYELHSRFISSFAAGGRNEAKKEGRRHGHSGLRFWGRCLQRRNSLRSNSRLCFTASPPKSSPAGRPPWERAGRCTSSLLCRAFFECPFPLISSFLMGVRTHITILTRSKLSADRCGDTAGQFPVL